MIQSNHIQSISNPSIYQCVYHLLIDVSIIYLPMNIVYTCSKDDEVNAETLSTGETFCRQVTTRLRCSSQLPWLQKSEMVEYAGVTGIIRTMAWNCTAFPV